MVVLEKNGGVFSSIDVDDPIGTLVGQVIQNSAFMIVDGITTELKRKMGQARISVSEHTAKLVFVSSYSITLPDENKDGWIKAEMFSWTYDQYIKACSNDVFLEGIRSNIIDSGVSGKDWDYHMDSKFNLAGGSARWFFGFSPTRAKDDIETFIDKVGISSGSTSGHRKKGFVHHLFALFDDKREDFVSQFVARTLAVFHDMSFIRDLLNKEVVKKKKSLGGWIFEWAFLTSLRSALMTKSRIVVYNSCGEEKWDVKGLENDFDPEKPTKPYNDNDWLIPVKYNQGGYDFLQLARVEQSYLLRVVQITHGMKHPYKLEFVFSLLQHLSELNIGEIKFLDVVIVHKKKDQPPSHSTTGDLQLRVFIDFCSKTQWTVENIRVLSFDVHHVVST
jgi:hypothetical protein